MDKRLLEDIRRKGGATTRFIGREMARDSKDYDKLVWYFDRMGLDIDFGRSLAAVMLRRGINYEDFMRQGIIAIKNAKIYLPQPMRDVITGQHARTAVRPNREAYFDVEEEGAQPPPRPLLEPEPEEGPPPVDLRASYNPAQMRDVWGRSGFGGDFPAAASSASVASDSSGYHSAGSRLGYTDSSSTPPGSEWSSTDTEPEPEPELPRQPPPPPPLQTLRPSVRAALRRVPPSAAPGVSADDHSRAYRDTLPDDEDNFYDRSGLG